MEQSTANKFFALQTSTAGAVAASLLHRAAESPLSIAINAFVQHCRVARFRDLEHGVG